MDIRTVFSALAGFIRGRSLYELFPNEFMENIPYERVKSCCCIRCLRPMSNEDMFPRSRLTPRAICPECWVTLTVNLSEKCWVCGDYLENWRFDRQKSQRHDLHFRIHEGRCRDYFSLVSVKALGWNTGIREETNRYDSPQLTPRQIPQQTRTAPQQNFIEGEYEEVNARNKKALPPPAELLRFEPQSRKIFSFIPTKQGFCEKRGRN